MSKLDEYLLIALLCTGLLVATASAQTEPATFDEAITNSATQHRYELAYDGQEFSGPAWHKLLDEARAAQFFLIGEEHGIAENPKLAAQLFTALTGSGYSRVAIEISPPMAMVLDRVLLADGVDGLRALFAMHGGEPAFFGMQEEALFLAAVRATSDQSTPVLWGADYEVGGDPHLLRLLDVKSKPPAAAEALARLKAASDASWNRYYTTGGPQFIFSFAGDPAMVRAIRDAWPDHDDDTAWILDTLEETLEINRLWADGNGWQSNARRAALLRDNFLRHWARSKAQDEAPKVLAKFGASHMVRGRSMTETFDLGTLLPELAAAEGGTAASVFVVPGRNAKTAVLDPTEWKYKPAPGKDNYLSGLKPLVDASLPDAFTLLDLRPLRSLLTPRKSREHHELARIVHGFDLMLIMTGGTASGELQHAKPQPPH